MLLTRTFAGPLIDAEEDPYPRAVLVGPLKEAATFALGPN
jgi:hypothetical protein